MNFQKIRPQKIYEKVAEQIKTMIEEGELKPGDKLLSVKDLAEQLNVGRSAVREALSALQAMGLIELRQGEGTFVRQLSPKELLDINYDSILVDMNQLESLLEVRKIIESSYVELAAKRRDLDDLKSLQEAINMMENDLNSDTHGEEADWLFHYAIAKATKNDMLVYMIENIGDSIKRNTKANRQILFQKVGTPEILIEEHRNVYQAIADKDGTLAKKLLYDHLHHVEVQIKDIVENKTK